MSPSIHFDLPSDEHQRTDPGAALDLFPGILVGKTNVGWGVFAARPFAAGELVLTFRGPILEGEAGMALSDTVQIGKDRYVDPIPPVKFVNHHCKPNTGLNHVQLHALRPILEGEEIRFDYSTCMGESNWTMQCRCGSPECRREIVDFVLLPAELQAHYLALGIVQPYLITQNSLWQARDLLNEPAVLPGAASPSQMIDDAVCHYV